MRKRQAFEHEHEIRALVWPPDAPVMERFAPDLVDRLTWSRMRGVPLY